MIDCCLFRCRYCHFIERHFHDAFDADAAIRHTSLFHSLLFRHMRKYTRLGDKTIFADFAFRHAAPLFYVYVTIFAPLRHDFLR